MPITVNLEDDSRMYLALIQQVLHLDQDSALSWALSYAGAQAATLALALGHTDDEERGERRERAE